MKKILLNSILIAFMISCTAEAAGVRCENESNRIKIIASTEPDTKVNILVGKSGTDLNITENIFEMMQVTSDENGNVLYDFTFPTSRYGKSTYGLYDVILKPEGKEMQKGELAFATDSEIADCMSAMKETGADFSAIFAGSSEYRIQLKAMGCLMDEYDKSANKSLIVSMFTDEFDASCDSEKTKQIFNNIIAIQKIADKETAKNALNEFSPAFEDKKYDEFDEKRQEWLAEHLLDYLPYQSVSVYEERYALLNSLYSVSTSKFDKFTDNLKKYEQVLGITNNSAYKSYLALSESNRIKANENLAVIMKNAPAGTVDKLCDNINAAISGLTNSSNNGGSGGGGGGSSSASVGGFAVVTGETGGVTPENNADKKSGEFTDLEDVKWAKEAIETLREKGIVSGKEKGIFAPNDSLTREEFVTMAVRAIGLQTKGENAYFDDVSEGDWCYPYVSAAFNNKIINGISETSFGKGKNITRQDMAVIVHRAAKGRVSLFYGREMVDFADANNISEYAKAAIEELYKTGAVNGSDDGYFYPLNTATRAEAAIIIYKLFAK